MGRWFDREGRKRETFGIKLCLGSMARSPMLQGSGPRPSARGVEVGESGEERPSDEPARISTSSSSRAQGPHPFLRKFSARGARRQKTLKNPALTAKDWSACAGLPSATPPGVAPARAVANQSPAVGMAHQARRFKQQQRYTYLVVVTRWLK